MFELPHISLVANELLEKGLNKHNEKPFSYIAKSLLSGHGEYDDPSGENPLSKTEGSLRITAASLKTIKV